MVSKPKKRQVAKVRSVTPEPPKSLPHQDNQSVESLKIYNGTLVEDLFKSEPWQVIVKPLLDESVAGVSGRFTNGRYWHGRLTTDWKAETPVFLAGYQKALMDFHNNLHDFVIEKKKLIETKKDKADEANAPVINPFMEEYGE